MPTIPTVLALTGVGIPPYSARGIMQTYSHIGNAGNLRRTINGALKDISDPLFRKYASQLSASDMDPPAIDGVWPGLQVSVDWVAELAVQGEHEESSEGVSEGSLGRIPVPGSVRIDGGYTFYRPRMDMLIVGFNVNVDEWGAATSWTMSLEEV